MKPKLALIVLLLVILPTAVLSIMASRALKNRELVLQSRLETSAVDAIPEVSSRIIAQLDVALEQVRIGMSDCLARGGNPAAMQVAAVRLRDSHAIIKHVHLFMNPWGFIWPETPAEPARHSLDPKSTSQRTEIGREKIEDRSRRTEERGQTRHRTGKSRNGGSGDSSRHRQALIAALRREIAFSGALVHAIRFTVDNASYCFSQLRGTRSLYAGYEVDPEEFVRQLSCTVRAISGRGILLSAKGPGITVPIPGRGEPGEIIVSDSLDRSSEIRNPGSDRSSAIIAEGRLAPPFDFVEVTAFMENPDEMRRAGRFQARLYAWGILVLAGGIVAGAWIVLREAATEIRKARSRSDFVIGVSHDLRTPVSSMKMLSESLYLDRVTDPGKQKKFLGTIVTECERLSQMVERILFFVRFGQNALVYQMKEIDTGNLVDSAVRMFRVQFGSELDRRQGAFPASSPIGELSRGEIREHRDSPGMTRKNTGKQRMHFTLEPGLPMINADESAMTQVLMNLLDNAVKYSGGRRPVESMPGRHVTAATRNETAVSEGECPEKAQEKTRTNDGQARIEIEARVVTRKRCLLQPRKKWVSISVRDHGIGMERKELRRIFRRFYRVPGATGDNVSGVGLGLALCRHVVAAHGGWIDAESMLGGGSTFSVLLPVAKGAKARHRGNMKR